MKRDLNVYTLFLACCGLAFIPFVVYSDDWTFVLIASLLSALLDLFPIELPGGLVYSTSGMIYLYAGMRYGLADCAVPVMVSIAVLFGIRARGHFTVSYLYRGIVTVGMYALGLTAAVFAARALPDAPSLLQAAVAVTVFEVSNIVFLLLIRWSSSPTQFFQRHLREFRGMIITFPIQTVLLAELLRAQDSATLLTAAISVIVVACVLIILSRAYARTETRRRESEEYYQLIAQNTPDGILILNHKDEVTYASPSNLQLMGSTLSSYRGPWTQHVCEQDRPLATQMIAHARNSRQAVTDRLRLQTEMGTDLIAETTIAPIADSQVSDSRLIVINRDMTEQDRAEERLRKADKLAAVGQLAAGIAHEIRNPLTSLKGFLQLSRDSFQHREHYDIMMAELSSIEMIVNEFLVLSKPQISHRQPTDIVALLQSVVTLTDAQAMLVGVTLSTEVTGDIPPIFSNEGQIKQVLINLLRNALEATSPEGGSIHIRVSHERDMVQISMQDTGMGIPQEQLSRLGEPFFTTKEKGTGLGLMVTYRIIQEHGGTMQITSTVGQGTHVSINIPVSPEAM